MALNFEDHGKRAMDVAISAMGLVLTAPLALVVAAAVALESGRPVLFIQNRVGQCGELFTLLKFRSMSVGTPDVESSAAEAVTITSVGRVIRRLNLDELPQLINVFRGEMSLVGPRPALPSQTDLLALRERGGADHVRPGLTGLAQVHSYDGMTVPEKASYDVRYAAELGLVTDLKIFLKTVTYLLSPPPVY